MMKNRTPLKSIRAYCLSCCGDSAYEVRLCVYTQCTLYPYRFGKRPANDFQSAAPVLTPVKAIRKRCLDCSGFMPSEVRSCLLPECPLYMFRMGKNPNCRRVVEPDARITYFSPKTATRLPYPAFEVSGMNSGSSACKKQEKNRYVQV